MIILTLKTKQITNLKITILYSRIIKNVVSNLGIQNGQEEVDHNLNFCG